MIHSGWESEQPDTTGGVTTRLTTQLSELTHFVNVKSGCKLDGSARVKGDHVYVHIHRGTSLGLYSPAS